MAKVNKKTLILVLALATFAICFLCGLAILIGDSEPTAELAQVSATATKAATGTATETPQPTPTFTPTSEPPTSTPTATATKTPTPTSTLLPDQQLEAALRRSLFGDRITSIANYNGELHIKWGIANGFTDSSIKKGAKYDIRGMLKVIAQFGPGLNYTGVIINGSFPLIDQYGNTEDSLVVDAYYSRGTIEKINFDMFLADNVYVIADKLYIHPVFRD